MKGSGIGGQAVMEGVMMKNGSKYAVAVRKPDGEVVVDTKKFKKTGEGIKLFDLPLFRGVIAFIDSLRLGVGTLMYSADLSTEEEEEEGKKKSPEAKKKEDTLVMTLTVIFAVVLAIGIFMILPYFLSQLLKKVITSAVLLTLCEGLIRIGLFIGYVAAISCMKEIKRVFMYHGAEHKSINCVEHGLELTVANVRKSSRRHKRCGTSFLLIVMLISIVLFMFIRVENAWLRILFRLLLIPVIAGISYEFIRLAGKSDSVIVNILSKPGLALQGLTTSEPDDSMIEVAIASVEAVFDWKKFLADYDKKPDSKANYAPCCDPDDTKDTDADADDEPGTSKGRDGKDGQNSSGNKDNKDRNNAKNSNKNNKNNKNNNNKNNNNNSNKDKKNNDSERGDRDNSKNRGTNVSNNNVNGVNGVNDAKSVNNISNTGSDKAKAADDKSGKNDKIDKKPETDIKTKGSGKYSGVREALPVDDDEDDEILKALDQYFIKKNGSSEDK